LALTCRDGFVTPKYRNKANNEYKYQIEDIRQLSGYARDEKIRTCLKIDNTTIAKCLIIYPNKDKTDNDLSNLLLLGRVTNPSLLCAVI
jgi:hypothetical protein